MSTRTSTAEPTRTYIALWTGILAGPIAWAIDEVIGYTATPHACSTGHTYVLHVLTLATLAVCAVGFLSAWEARLRSPASLADDNAEQRRTFMSYGGMILNIGFAMVIIATAIPRWMLSPCY